MAQEESPNVNEAFPLPISLHVLNMSLVELYCPYIAHKNEL